MRSEAYLKQARRADPLWLKKSVNLSGGLLLVMVAVHGLLS